MDLHYLDEDIIVEVPNIPAGTNGIYNYTLYYQTDQGQIGPLFFGNTFITSGTTSKKFDITDLIKNERYVCKDLFDNSTGMNIITTYYVTLTINGTGYSSNTIQVCMQYRSPRLLPKLDCDYLDFNQWPAPAEKVSICLSGLQNGQYQLLPTIPLVDSSVFGLPMLIDKWGDYQNHSMTLLADGTYYSTGHNFTLDYHIFTHKFVTLHQLYNNLRSVSGNYPSRIYLVDNTDEVKYHIANYDKCPAKYYVCWQDRSGGFQIQPFSKTETYFENYSRQEIIRYNYKRKLNNLQIQPKFSVQTGYVTEDIYPFYETIFQSSYIKLYDAEFDILYDVVITDNSYTEKTYMNQGRQLFNIKLTLEIAKKQNITY